MRRLTPLGLASLAIGLGACSPSSGSDAEALIAPESVPEIETSLGETPGDLSARGEMVVADDQSRSAGVYAEPCVITETSIAGISNPATLGAFARAFPAGTSLAFEPLHMVDFGSLCLIVGGHDRVCTLFYEAEVEAWDPGAEALGLYTLDPSCSTADGIGPGSAVTDAEAAFGAPEFSFNYDNEGREYVDFAAAPDAMAFRVASHQGEAVASEVAGRSTLWPNGAFGGDYRDSSENFVTSVAMPDAVIAEISIY